MGEYIPGNVTPQVSQLDAGVLVHGGVMRDVVVRKRSEVGGWKSHARGMGAREQEEQRISMVHS